MLNVFFPLATASTHWGLELHALGIYPPFLLENPPSFVLAPNTMFRQKMATEIVLFSDMELSPLCTAYASPEFSFKL